MRFFLYRLPDAEFASVSKAAFTLKGVKHLKRLSDSTCFRAVLRLDLDWISLSCGLGLLLLHPHLSGSDLKTPLESSQTRLWLVLLLPAQLKSYYWFCCCFELRWLCSDSGSSKVCSKTYLCFKSIGAFTMRRMQKTVQKLSVQRRTLHSQWTPYWRRSGSSVTPLAC